MVSIPRLVRTKDQWKKREKAKERKLQTNTYLAPLGTRLRSYWVVVRSSIAFPRLARTRDLLNAVSSTVVSNSNAFTTVPKTFPVDRRKLFLRLARTKDLEYEKMGKNILACNQQKNDKQI